MRYPAERKLNTRGRIIDQARRSFMCNGRNGIGVDGIMRNAGLTAGGFYSHFDSKDALFTLALERAFEHSMVIFFRDFEAAGSDEAIATLTRRYLSRDHRDQVEEGCPMTALAADIARSGRRTRSKFESGLDAVAQTMAAAFATGGDLDPKEQALALIALYVGGTILARSTKGGPLSDKMLVACRKQAKRNAAVRRMQNPGAV